MSAKRSGQRSARRFLVRSAVYFLVTALLILVAVSYTEYREARAESRQLKTEERLRLSLAERIATRELFEVAGDLRTLAERMVVRAFLRTPGLVTRSAVERAFREVAESYRRYDRITLLDLGGRELVRVDYRDGVATVAPPERLGAQAAGHCMNEARALPPGTIFVSRIERGLDEGASGGPEAPTLCVATLAQDESARPRAVLMVSYRVTSMVSRFHELVAGGPGEPMFLDERGEWIRPTEAAEERGASLHRASNFATRFPAAWKQMAREDSGIVRAPGGTFVFRTLRPAPPGYVTRTEAVWKLVIRLAEVSDVGPLVAYRRKPVLVAILLTLGAWVSAVLAWLRTAELERRSALIESEDRLEAAQALAHVGHWEWDIPEGTLTWSDEVYRIFGHEPGAFVPTYAMFLEAIHADDRELVAAAVDAALESGAPYAIDHRIVRPNGEIRAVSERGSVLRDDAGTPVRMLGTVQDRTERQRAAEELQERKMLFSTLVERSPDMIGRLDRDLRSLYINPVIEQATGYPPEYFAGKDIRTVDLPPEARASWAENLPVVFATGEERTFEFSHPAPDGKTHYFSARAVPELGPDGRIETVLVVSRDITALREAEARIKADLELLKATHEALERQSREDALTGVSNRRHLFSYLETEWRRAARHGSPLSLILIDVDHFKAYNDHYGHVAGDECLRSVAQAMKAQVHRAGDLLARYGGEEFAVVLPETTSKGARELAENLRSAVAALHREHRFSSVAPYVTISVGVSERSPKAREMTEWIRLADSALYRAKESGRNKVVVSEEPLG